MKCAVRELEGTLVLLSSFRKEENIMNNINIAIECDFEHKEAVYTLATSIVLNKKAQSRYCVYFLINGTEKKVWTKLADLERQGVEIYFANDIKEISDKCDRIIQLQWNVLVMGDLTSLYNTDLEGNHCAIAKNFPENLYNISMGNGEYDKSVCIYDVTRGVTEGNCKELSVLYNLGYDEIIANKKVVEKSLKNDGTEVDILKQMAFIFRMDKERSADRYFDVALSELWMKYYKLSPIGSGRLDREAYVETMGDVSVERENAIPVLIPADDKDVVCVMALICSIEKKLSPEKTLDVRIAYTQLSTTHKKMLLSLRTTRVSIVLYNVKECFVYNNKKSYELLTASIFTRYEKALFIRGCRLCNSDISELYNQDINGYWIAMEDKNTECMLINVSEWNYNEVYDKTLSLANNNICRKYKMCDIINIVCARNVLRLKMNDTWSLMETDIEEYEKAVREYIGAFLSEEDIEKEIMSTPMREDDNVKEVLDKIQKLEKENARLTAQNKQLEKENKSLTKDRNRFLFEIEEIRKSFTYKVGRVLTFVPRKLRGKK